MTSGPCDTPVNPVQLIAVAVAVGVEVGRTRAVLVAVKVGAGGSVFTGVTCGILGEVGMKVAVEVGAMVGMKVAVITVGAGDGVLVSAANPVGSAFPTIGMDIRNERALADTISSGLSGRSLRIGS